LQGLSSGPHELRVRAGDAAGGKDRQPKVFSWATSNSTLLSPLPAANEEMQSLELLSCPRLVSPTTLAEFTLGGYSREHFKWRLDGGKWTEASSSQLAFTVTVGVPHVWEALPKDTESLWLGPPIVYR
jgi:hypothetical protein